MFTRWTINMIRFVGTALLMAWFQDIGGVARRECK